MFAHPLSVNPSDWFIDSASTPVYTLDQRYTILWGHKALPLPDFERDST